MNLPSRVGSNGVIIMVSISFPSVLTQEDCRHMALPMNYVRCSNWKESSAGYTMLCEIMQKLKVRAYCVMKDKQPQSLLTIVAHPHYGSVSTVMTFDKPGDKPPSDDLFIPPSDCRQKQFEINEDSMTGLLGHCNNANSHAKEEHPLPHQPHHRRPDKEHIIERVFGGHF